MRRPGAAAGLSWEWVRWEGVVRAQTLLPWHCHCPGTATASCLSPLCRCPTVSAMVGWL